MTIVPLARLLNNNEILLLEKDAYYSLKDRRVTDKVLTKFTSLVRNDSTLSALRLNGHNTTISLPVWQSLIEVAFCHPSITNVGLSGNALSLDHARVFSDVLQQHPQSNVTELHLSGSKCLPADGFSFIFESLRQNKTIEKLSITASRINIVTAARNIRLDQSIREMLQQNTTLKVLRFTDVGWDETFVVALTEGLQTNTSLTELEYCYSGLDDNAGIAFGNALCHNKTLTHLCLGFNRIGNDAAVVIAESLKSSNTTLKRLRLVRNAITERGFNAIAEAIKYNTSLEHIHCGCQDDCFDIDTIACIDALKYNTTLRDCNIYQRNKTPEAQNTLVNKVTELLEYNDTIATFDCSWTQTYAQKVKLNANSNSLRRAPKKAIRRNVVTWLLNNWVELYHSSERDTDTVPSPTRNVERKRKRREKNVEEI